MVYKAAEDFVAQFVRQQPQAAAAIPVNTDDGYLHAPNKFDPFFEGLMTIKNPYFIESAYNF